jgi:integrase/recombinase XerD
LPVDVGEAIAAYLRRGRPTSLARQIFIRSIPPRVALTRSGVSGLVLAASHRAGLGRDVRAHQLRHTAACDMIRAGAYWYLTAVPELMHLAADRLQHAGGRP